MTSLVAKEVSDWYVFFRQLLKDIRDFFPKEKKARLDLYDDLFRIVRFIHTDYISYFQNFMDTLTVNSSKNLRLAKKDFLKARSRHASQRTLAKFDAGSYLKLTEDISELRYLSSIIWYFHYTSDSSYVLETQTQLDFKLWIAQVDKDGGDGAWDSASSHFWSMIEDCKDSKEAKRMAGNLMDSVNKRFLLIMQSYTNLEMSWRLGKRPMQTIVSKDLMKVGGNQNGVADKGV